MYLCVRGHWFYLFLRFWYLFFELGPTLCYFLFFILFSLINKFSKNLKWEILLHTFFRKETKPHIYNKIKSFTCDCYLKCQILLHKFSQELVFFPRSPITHLPDLTMWEILRLSDKRNRSYLPFSNNWVNSRTFGWSCRGCHWSD